MRGAATRRMPSPAPCSTRIPHRPDAQRSSPNASARTTNASCPGLWASWPTPLAARRPSSSSFRPPMPDCHVQDAAATTRGSASIQAPILALGLPEEAFERENNLITASDVRAVILSRLRLPAWGTLWDVGAGSGSVGLEAAAPAPGPRHTRHRAQPRTLRDDRTQPPQHGHRQLHAASRQRTLRDPPVLPRAPRPKRIRRHPPPIRTAFSSAAGGKDLARRC